MSEQFKFTNGGLGYVCRLCTHSAGPYNQPVIAKRMARLHIQSKHPEHYVKVPGYVRKDGTSGPKVKPEAAAVAAPKPVKPKKQQRAVNFCPCCGTNLRAIEVAMSL